MNEQWVSQIYLFTLQQSLAQNADSVNDTVRRVRNTVIMRLLLELMLRKAHIDRVSVPKFVLRTESLCFQELRNLRI